MKWFNYWGLVIFIIIMIPNIIYATKHKVSVDNKYTNKAVSIIEQIGRYGSMVFMIFHIPNLSQGFWFNKSQIVFVSVNAVMLAFYCICWAIFWNKNTLSKALSLSIAPSVIFLFSGAITINIPLIITAILFCIGHITTSVKNYKNI